MKLTQKFGKLAALMSLPSLDGHIFLLAGTGLLTLQTAPAIALSLISGPVAMVMAATLEGALKERVLASLFAGLIATISVVIAAFLGAKLVNILNFDVLKVFGATVVTIIGLMLFGLKIPDKLPMGVMALGLVVSLIWR